MENSNYLQLVQSRLKGVCEKLELDPAVYEILKQPQRILTVTFPVKMDDGTTKVFKGFRSQHTDAVGPTKGGLRFHPEETMEDVMALSMDMSFKCSVVGLPYGGGKGGVICNPKELSEGEKERLSRAFFRAISKIVGEHVDIPAPDVYTTPQMMAWMMDEYNKIQNRNVPGVITGKPIAIGGSLGRTEATGFGVAWMAREALIKLNIPLEGARVAVQGFGNVGSYAALKLQEYGCKVVAVTNSRSGIYAEEGIDIAGLMDYFNETGDIKGFKGTQEFNKEEVLTLDVEVLLPSALQLAITEKNMKDIKAKVISEGANGATSIEADQYLSDNGAIVIPGILANAGGVTVSYFEWVQNLANYYWTKEEVFEKEEKLMVDAFEETYAIMKQYNVPMSQAAYMKSVKRIAEVMKLRGWY